MLKWMLVFFLLLQQVCAEAQATNKRDSLLQLLVNALGDTSTARTLLRLARYYETNNQDSSVYYLEKSKKLSASLNFIKGVYYYYEQISIVSFTRGEYDKSMDENNKGMQLARHLKDSALIITMLNHIGIVYGLKMDYQKTTGVFIAGTQRNRCNQ